MKRSAPDDFWSRVDRRKNDECWPFLGSHRNGYGNLSYQGKMWMAHRLAWTLTYGAIPETAVTQHGTVIRHQCDNPTCCNPRHLLSGTQIDNIKDRHYRGRNASFNISHKGEAHPSVRLTAKQVRKIRRSTKTDMELADFYDVIRSCIYAVRSYVTWRHI